MKTEMFYTQLQVINHIISFKLFLLLTILIIANCGVIIRWKYEEVCCIFITNPTINNFNQCRGGLFNRSQLVGTIYWVYNIVCYWNSRPNCYYKVWNFFYEIIRCYDIWRMRCHNWHDILTWTYGGSFNNTIYIWVLGILKSPKNARKQISLCKYRQKVGIWRFWFWWWFYSSNL